MSAGCRETMINQRSTPKELLDENAELLDENAKLLDENAKLLDENVELRELVRKMWQSCPVYVDNCYGCEYHRSDGECELYDRMEQLGVEVDG